MRSRLHHSRAPQFLRMHWYLRIVSFFGDIWNVTQWNIISRNHPILACGGREIFYKLRSNRKFTSVSVKFNFCFNKARKYMSRKNFRILMGLKVTIKKLESKFIFMKVKVGVTSHRKGENQILKMRPSGMSTLAHVSQAFLGALHCLLISQE